MKTHSSSIQLLQGIHHFFALEKWKNSLKEAYRYFIASGIALLVDIGTFSLFLRFFDFDWFFAATTSFIFGMVTAYTISIAWVFENRVFSKNKISEFFVFLLIGLAGLAVTQGILWLGIGWFDWIPEMVKISAAGITFAFNFLVRKIFLFRKNIQPEPIPNR